MTGGSVEFPAFILLVRNEERPGRQRRTGLRLWKESLTLRLRRVVLEALPAAI